MRSSRSQHLVLLTLLIASLTVAAAAKKFPMEVGTSVPAATGNVEVGKDDNGNTRYTVTVHHLADPAKLTPAKAAYVVWVQPKGEEAHKAGQLTVGDDLKGEFKGTTPAKDFEVFVTAEDGPTVDTPSGDRVLRANVSR
jgi:hypothetical protein